MQMQWASWLVAAIVVVVVAAAAAVAASAAKVDVVNISLLMLAIVHTKNRKSTTR